MSILFLCVSSVICRCVFCVGFQGCHVIAMYLFQDDEYVVYSPEQVKLKYVVQFSLEDDPVKGFQPNINTSSTELELPFATSDLCM